MNGDGRIDLADVELLIKNDKNVLTKLEGNGDFRSAECVELLKESDIVVTNPPFSLFREYVAQLVQYGKRFLIIGNKQAIKYKEIFPYIRDNKLWLGYTPTSREIYFDVPQSFIDIALSQNKDRTIVSHAGRLMARSSSIWYTNLEHKKRHEEYVFIRRYNPTDYQHYANYDAIDISESNAIPEDWSGMMGVRAQSADGPSKLPVGIRLGRRFADPAFACRSSRWTEEGVYLHVLPLKRGLADVTPARQCRDERGK